MSPQQVRSESLIPKFLGVVLYTGRESVPFAKDLFAVPIQAVWTDGSAWSDGALTSRVPAVAAREGPVMPHDLRLVPPLGPPPDLPSLCTELAAVLERVEDHKTALRLAEEERDRLELEIATQLEAAGMDSLPHDRWTFSPKRTVTWKVIPDERDAVVRLCKEGAPELVKETVNAASLAGYLRREESRLASEAPRWWQDLEPLLERTESLSLSVRKRAAK